MGTYYIPRNVKGETRIFYIFSIKSLISTVIGIAVGLPFLLIFSLINLKLAGFIITSMVTIVYAANNYYCDISLVLMLFVGAALGSWLGVKLSYKIPRYLLSITASIITFFMASKQIYKLLHPTINTSINNISDTAIEHSGSYTILCIIIIMLLSYLYKIVLDFLAKQISFKKDNASKKRGNKCK